LREAERVYSYFQNYCTIRLQGSIKTNTHIRYHSDVDVLTITDDFTTYEGTLPFGVSRYAADPIDTLKALRARNQNTVISNFPSVKIEPKDRALRLSGGSLQRQVDLVAANWYNTSDWMHTQNERDRGVQILDVRLNNRILNKPFLHEARINEKHVATSDGSGRAIRLLKTLKADAESNIAISSYDIAALIWNCENHRLPSGVGYSFFLAENVANYLLALVSAPAQLNALWVPNMTRHIIDAEGTTLEAVRALWYELYKLMEEIRKAGKNFGQRYLIEGRRLRAA